MRFRLDSPHDMVHQHDDVRVTRKEARSLAQAYLADALRDEAEGSPEIAAWAFEEACWWESKANGPAL